MGEHLINKKKLLPADIDTLKWINIMCGGLIAISLVIIQNFISSGVFTSIGTLEPSGLICVLGFAVAMPLLAASVLSNTLYIYYGYRRISDSNPTSRSRALSILTISGVISAFIGIASAFWHVFWITSLVFIIASIVATLLCIQATKSLVIKPSKGVRLTMYDDEEGNYHEIWEELPDSDRDALADTQE